MKKFVFALMLGLFVSLVSCGPSASELEAKRVNDSTRIADSLAKVQTEQTRIADSIAKAQYADSVKAAQATKTVKQVKKAK